MKFCNIVKVLIISTFCPGLGLNSSPVKLLPKICLERISELTLKGISCSKQVARQLNFFPEEINIPEIPAPSAQNSDFYNCETFAPSNHERNWHIPLPPKNCLKRISESTLEEISCSKQVIRQLNFSPNENMAQALDQNSDFYDCKNFAPFNSRRNPLTPLSPRICLKRISESTFEGRSCSKQVVKQLNFSSDQNLPGVSAQNSDFYDCKSFVPSGTEINRLIPSPSKNCLRRISESTLNEKSCSKQVVRQLNFSPNKNMAQALDQNSDFYDCKNFAPFNSRRNPLIPLSPRICLKRISESTFAGRSCSKQVVRQLNFSSDQNMPEVSAQNSDFHDCKNFAPSNTERNRLTLPPSKNCSKRTSKSSLKRRRFSKQVVRKLNFSSDENITPVSDHNNDFYDSKYFVPSKNIRNSLTPLSPRICLTRISKSTFKGKSCSKEVSRQLNFSLDQNIPEILAQNSDSDDCKRVKKKNFCLFCKKLFSQLPRHLEHCHENEDEVRKFMFLPRGSEERKILLNALRKKGNFEHNTSETVNSSTVIACRKTRSKNDRTISCCSNCKGFYSKSSIRKHYRKCCSAEKGDRSAIRESRRLLRRLHPCASANLSNKIFPPLREDNITDCIRYDEMIIKFGNKLCEKYRLEHHCKMIRSRLRLLGRLLLEMRIIDPLVKDIKSCFIPERYDTVIKAVNKVAHLDENTTKYESPSTAAELGTLLKKIGKTIVVDTIKYKDEKRKCRTENFLRLLEEDFCVSVNITARENQMLIKRQKKVTLPSLDDIQILYNYLSNKTMYLENELKKSFSLKIWIELASCVLVSIQVFNRRRPGEMERMSLNDFKSYETIDENIDKDLYNTLNSESREAAKNYVRLTIRGKLGRTVPVLLSKHLLNCILLLNQHRKDANISDNNSYIFAVPNKTHGHLDACKILREYSEQCGVQNPAVLRGTLLRKHIATNSSLLNLQDSIISDLAQYMGHSKPIHKNIYTVPKARDITVMSKVLSSALGRNENENFKNNEINDTLHQENEDLLLETGNGNSGNNAINVALQQENEHALLESGNENSENDGINATFQQENEYALLETANEDAENEINATKQQKNQAALLETDALTIKIARKSWSTPEKKIARETMKYFIENETLPSLLKCFHVIKEYPELQRRTPQQLKLWVHNNIERKREYSTPTKTVRSNRTWITPERATMRMLFSHHLKNETLPSLSECQEKIYQNKNIQHRSATSVKAWVNNEINRRKQRSVEEIRFAA